MKRAASQRAWQRLAGAEQRAGARRIERHRMQRKAEREPQRERDEHLAQLAALYDVLGSGHFSEQEIFEAQAALQQPADARQRALPLRGDGRHA